MKPVDVKSSVYIEFNKENDKEGSKFQVGDDVRISKCKNVFAKGYLPNWFENVFLIKNIKNSVPWAYFIKDINDEQTAATLYEK